MSNHAAEHLKTQLIYAVRKVAPDAAAPMEQVLADTNAPQDQVWSRLDELLTRFLYACMDDDAPLVPGGNPSEQINCFSFCYIYSRYRDLPDCKLIAEHFLEPLCDAAGTDFPQFRSFCDAQYTGICFSEKL